MAAPTLRGLFPTRNPISPTGLRIALKIVQLCGLFRIARLITSNGLRILCYHGFALADEYKYRGTLFIKDELFSRRMEYLKRNNYPILSLDNALDALSKGRLPPCTTAITMGDGWRGVYTQALPILRKLQIPQWQLAENRLLRRGLPPAIGS